MCGVHASATYTNHSDLALLLGDGLSLGESQVAGHSICIYGVYRQFMYIMVRVYIGLLLLCLAGEIEFYMGVHILLSIRYRPGYACLGTFY